MYDSLWTRDKNIRNLFVDGNYKSLLLLTMQYPHEMPPSLRTSADFVFIFRDNIVQSRKRTYDKTFDMFCEVMDQYTQDYGCLVIDMSAKSNKLEDQVFWYRADGNVPDFQMMSESLNSVEFYGKKRRRMSCDEVGVEDRLRREDT